MINSSHFTLSPESQKLIQDVVIEWEAKSYTDRQVSVKGDRAAFEAKGVKFVPMSDEATAAYLKMAAGAAWGRLKGRLDEMGDDDAGYDQMRALYHPE